MKLNKKPIILIKLSFLAFALIAGVFIFSKVTFAIEPSDIVIINPYKLDTKNSLKGNLHAHSYHGPVDGVGRNNDDGTKLMSVTDIGNWYKANGYGFYALTSHFQPYSSIKHPNNPLNSRMTIAPQPKVDGIIWMGPSIENSLNTIDNRLDCAHTGMINLASSLYDKKKVGKYTEMIANSSKLSKLGKDNQSVIDAVIKGGGLIIFNHPYYQYTSGKDDNGNNIFTYDDDYTGCTDPDAVKGLRELNNITGLELSSGYVTNKKDNKGDLWDGMGPWDYMLMRDKKVWGFNNDDSHDNVHRNSKGDLTVTRGSAFNIVKTDGKNTKESIIKNIKAGNFYSSSPVDVGYTGVDPAKGKKDKDTPFKATGEKGYRAPSGYYDLDVTSSGNVIKVVTTNGTAIRSVVGRKDGTIVETVHNVTTLEFSVWGSEKYVRFEILKDRKEVAWSQPVYIALRPSVGFTTANTTKIASVSVGSEVELKNGIVVSANSPVGEKVAMKVVYKKIKDKNGKAVVDRWHNFGCHTSSSPDGSSVDRESKPLYDCKVAKSNGISGRGWTDKNKDGSVDFIANGSSQTFPGGNTKLKLSAGTYTWAAQSQSQSTPKTGVYSKWARGYEVVITDPIAKPSKPGLRAVNSTKGINITLGDVNCASGTTVQYRTRNSFNDGAWSVWSTWSSVKTKNIPAQFGYKNSFSVQARCSGYATISPESDVNYSSVAVYTSLDYPRKMKIKTATYKVNPLSNAKLGTELKIGTPLEFKSKIMIKGQWHLRTTTDTTNGVDAVVPFNYLSEI